MVYAKVTLWLRRYSCYIAVETNLKQTRGIHMLSPIIFMHNFASPRRVQLTILCLLVWLAAARPAVVRAQEPACYDPQTKKQIPCPPTPEGGGSDGFSYSPSGAQQQPISTAFGSAAPGRPNDRLGSAGSGLALASSLVSIGGGGLLAGAATPGALGRLPCQG